MTTIHHATAKKAAKLGLEFHEDAGGFEVRTIGENATVMGFSSESPKLALENAVKAMADNVAAEIEPIEPQVDSESDDQEEAPRKSIVKAHYRAEYKARGNANTCGDDLSEVLGAALTSKVTVQKTLPSGKTRKITRDALDFTKLVVLCKENGIDPERWSHLNNGQIRMNASNAMRRMLRNGETVKIGKVNYTAEDLGMDLPEEV